MSTTITKTLNNRLVEFTRRNPQKKIFFLHFPKCGGNSVNKAIRSSFNYFERHRFFHLQPQASLRAAEISEADLMDYREKILLYNMSRSDCNYISGHFKYSEKAYEAFGNQWHFITVLRHPVHKWFSHYFYNKFKEDSHFRIEESIEEFLETDRGIELGCDYVSKLTAISAAIDYTSQEAIEEAIANLHKFSLVGTIEDTNYFAQQYQELFGSRILIKKENKNPLSKAKQQEEITDKIRHKVEELCKPNLKIYESALEKTKAA